jgi:hypothetical protein
MTREPRASLSPDIVRKGEGAIQEPLPERPLNVEAAPPREPMTAMTVRMPETMAERLRLLAFRTRRGKGDLVVDALARFLDGAGV